MEVRQLKKLRKTELFELLLTQSQKIDALSQRVEELERALENKEIRLQEAGSIAEASLTLTRIFEEAQAAADLYLYNVKNLMGALDET